MIVDDHPVMRAGLRDFLVAYPDLEVVGGAADGLEALSGVDAVRPDVVLLALELPGMDGFELTRRLVAARPELKVLVLTRLTGGGPVRRALEAGAHGYLSKSISAAELAAAIHAVHAGRRVLGPEAADALAAVVSEPSVGADLSGREREVLALMAAGLTNRRIAERLGVSPATVKFHVRRIVGKLGVATRTE